MHYNQWPMRGHRHDDQSEVIMTQINGTRGPIRGHDGNDDQNQRAGWPMTEFIIITSRAAFIMVNEIYQYSEVTWINHWKTLRRANYCFIFRIAPSGSAWPCSPRTWRTPAWSCPPWGKTQGRRRCSASPRPPWPPPTPSCQTWFITILKKIKVCLYLAAPRPHVLAVDAVQVSQVLDGVINLLRNKMKQYSRHRKKNYSYTFSTTWRIKSRGWLISRFNRSRPI